MSNGVEVADISDEQAYANARLLAAAPELLEALEFCESIMEEDIGNLLTGDAMADAGVYDAINKASAAIAKAKGE